MAPANAGLDSNVPINDGDASQLHVLDLPQLYSKPSAQSLLSATALLAVAPSSWAVKAGEAKPAPSISEDGVPSYLTRIISSPLAWIPSDTDREAVWEAASQRLAERSGRTAMPSVCRTFKIPLNSHDSSETVDIKLHEPSLTGDNLGHKTWVASYLLAKRLPILLPRLFPGIKTSSEIHNLHPIKNPHHQYDIIPHPHILELGAGTGLIGLAASALFETTTHLTDLPSILPNLQRNLAENAPLTASHSTVTAGPLDWSLHQHRDNESNIPSEDPTPTYDLILASDTLYAPQHPTWLVNVIGSSLKRDEERRARVVIELPFRSEEPPEHEELRARMREGGFVVVEEGEEVGFDDWEDLRAEGGQLVVRCWWCVWGWG